MGISEKDYFFFLEVLKDKVLNLVYKTNIFIKLLKLMVIFLQWRICLYLFFRGIFSFVINRKHLLSTLLRLEFIVLSLFLIIVFFLRYFSYELYFRMFFLIFRVCEGALGVSILVSIIRTHGNDYFNSFSILQC